MTSEDRAAPRTEAGKRLLDDLDGFDATIVSAVAWSVVSAALLEVEREAAAAPQIDVERLYEAMVWLDNDDPGAFNIVAISEPDTRPVAAALAERYARLSPPPVAAVAGQMTREPR